MTRTRAIAISLASAKTATFGAIAVASAVIAGQDLQLEAPSAATGTETAEGSAIPDLPDISPDNPALKTLSFPVSSTPERYIKPLRDVTDRVPDRAVIAYTRAEQILATADADCRLPWTILAAVGEVTTKHGEAGQHRIDPNGVATPAIVGAIPTVSDTGSQTEKHPDTDGGATDSDTRFDHVVGPLSITPARWTVAAVDGDADGIRDPQDIDDAALATGIMLCTSAKAIDLRVHQAVALRTINSYPGFVDAVLLQEQKYRRFATDRAEDVALPVAARTAMPAKPSAIGASPGPSESSSNPRARWTSTAIRGDWYRTDRPHPHPGPGSPSNPWCSESPTKSASPASSATEAVTPGPISSEPAMSSGITTTAAALPSADGGPWPSGTVAVSPTASPWSRDDDRCETSSSSD